METKRVGDAMKMMNKNQKELSDNAAPQQAAAAVGSCDSGMLQSLNLPWGGAGRKNNVGNEELTIFYGGKVSVFEWIPADKAREIMLMAMGAAAAANNVTTSNYNLSSSSSSSSMQTTANAFNPLSKLKSAELPITRTYSLQRFLEKRRDRLVNRGPYSTNMAAEIKGANNHSHTAMPEAA